MDNINYNPNNGANDGRNPSGRVGKFQSSRTEETTYNTNERETPDSDRAPLYPKPPTILRQISTHIDNSTNLSTGKKLFGICLACLALLLVCVRWSQQETMIQSNQDR